MKSLASRKVDIVSDLSLKAGSFYGNIIVTDREKIECEIAAAVGSCGRGDIGQLIFDLNMRVRDDTTCLIGDGSINGSGIDLSEIHATGKNESGATQ